MKITYKPSILLPILALGATSLQTWSVASVEAESDKDKNPLAEKYLIVTSAKTQAGYSSNQVKAIPKDDKTKAEVKKTENHQERGGVMNLEDSGVLSQFMAAGPAEQNYGAGVFLEDDGQHDVQAWKHPVETRDHAMASRLRVDAGTMKRNVAMVHHRPKTRNVKGSTTSSKEGGASKTTKSSSYDYYADDYYYNNNYYDDYNY